MPDVAPATSVAAVVFGAWAFASLSRLGGAERVLAGCTAVIAQLSGTTLLLGLISKLTPRWLLVANLAWALGAVVIAQRVGRLRRPRIAQALKGHAVALRAVMANPLGAGLTVLVALQLAWSLYTVWLLPPYSWDEVWYHLSTPAHWLQEGGLAYNPFQLFSNAYPANGQLMFAWLLLVEGGDTWVQLGQLLFALFGGVGTSVLARRFGLSVPGAVAAGCLFVATPIVFAQATTVNVDVVLAGSFLLALASAAQWSEAVRQGAPRHRTVWLLALAGFLSGVTAGVKPAGVIWAGAISVFVVGHLVGTACTGSSSRWRPVAFGLAIFAVAAAPLGSFWYLRNLITEGNPIAPIELSVGDQVLFGGTIRLDQIVTDGYSTLEGVHGAELVVRSWLNEPTRTSPEQRLGGFGVQWPALMVPALAVGTAVLALQRRWAALAVVGVVTLAFLGQPSKWWLRFTIPIVAPGAIFLVLAVEGARQRAVRLVMSLVIVSVVAWSTWSAVPRVTFNDPEGFSLGEMLDLRARPASDRTFGALVAPSLFSWVDEIPDDGTIAVAAPGIFPPFYYPLYGPELDRRVVYLEDIGEADPTALDAVVATVALSSGGAVREPRAPSGFRLLTATGDLRVFVPECRIGVRGGDD